MPETKRHLSMTDIARLTKWAADLREEHEPLTRLEWEAKAANETAIGATYDALERIAGEVGKPLRVRRAGRMNRNALASAMAARGDELCALVSEVLASSETDLPSGVTERLASASTALANLASDWRSRMGGDE